MRRTRKVELIYKKVSKKSVNQSELLILVNISQLEIV